MRNLLVLLSVIISSKSVYSVELDSDTILRNSIPCIVSIGASHLLLKKDQMAIGAIGCAVSLGTMYSISNDTKRVELDNKMQAFQNKLLNDIKRNQDKDKAELAMFRDTVRKVLAEKILEERNKIEDLMVQTLDKKDFKNKITREVERMTRERSSVAAKGIDDYLKKHKERIVTKVVDEAVNRIMNKKYGGVSDSISTEKESASELEDLAQ